MSSLGRATGVYVPSKMTNEALLASFVSTLKIEVSGPSAHRQVDLTITRLGFGKKCTRCSGSGHHLFYPGAGTYCFRCGGEGEFLPSLTPSLLKKVRASVQGGALERLKERNELLSQARAASRSIVDAIKSTQPEGYDVSKATLTPDLFPQFAAFWPYHQRMTSVLSKFQKLKEPLEKRFTFRGNELEEILSLRDRAVEAIHRISSEIY